MKRALLLLLLISPGAFAASVTVTWTHPTMYTDGTVLALGEITKTRVEYGSCSGTAFGTKAGEVNVTAPAATTVITLGTGTHCFRAYTTAKGAESAPSNVASKTVVQPPPQPPQLLTVEETAYEIKPNGLVKQAGTVGLGVACRTTVVRVGGVTYTELDPTTVAFKPGNRPSMVWGRCALT